MLRSESDWDGMGDPGPSMPPSGSTNSEELFKAFLADCEDASASREQTAPPEAVVSQERHPNPAPMPGVAAEAEQNPPLLIGRDDLSLFERKVLYKRPAPVTPRFWTHCVILL